MITIITTPRPFIGHYGVIQRNAIKSWLALRPECEIILIGNEEGTAETAKEFGIGHISNVVCAESGLRHMDSMLEVAQNTAKGDIIAWMNADTMIIGNLTEVVNSINKPIFLMGAQRWNLDVNEELEGDWEYKILESLKVHGKLSPPDSGNIIVFPKGLFRNVPPFISGRCCDDNWLYYKIRSLGFPLVDATQVIKIIHQNHDYSPEWAKLRERHPDYVRNLALAGGYKHIYTLKNATIVLTPNGLKYRRVQAFIQDIWTYIKGIFVDLKYKISGWN
jgi:hypothetical protein